MPQDQVPLQLGAAQVEHPVLEPELLGGKIFVLLARDRDRGGLRGAHDLQLGDVHLDLARDQVGIAGRFGAQGHVPCGQDHRLRPQGGGTLHDVGRGPFGIERELHQPGAIAQVHEDQAAQVAAAMDPSAQAHPLPERGTRELATHVGAQTRGVHFSVLRRR